MITLREEKIMKLLNEQSKNIAEHVPERLKRISVLIMYRFAINGICDGMYICNRIANVCGQGDGEGIFTGDGTCSSREDYIRIARALRIAYASCIQFDDIEELADILETGELTYYKAMNSIDRQRRMIKKALKTMTGFEKEKLERRYDALTKTMRELAEDAREFRKAEKERGQITNVYVHKSLADQITRLLNTLPETEEDCFKEDDTITADKHFHNGKRISIELRGVKYEPGRGNLPYTQAVLYDNDTVLVKTERDIEFFKTWILEHDGIEYHAHVQPKTAVFMDAESRELNSIKNKNVKEMDYPKNLIYAVGVNDYKNLIHNVIALCENNLKDEQLKGLEHVISILNDTEQAAIRLYFEEKYTLRHAGELMNLSGERIRAIIAKALRKMRQEKNLNCILYGVTEAQKIESEKTEKIFATERPVREITLDEIKPSVRLYNALYRCGVKTLGELSDMTIERFRKIRNIGRNSEREAVELLNRYGLSFKDSSN